MQFNRKFFVLIIFIFSVLFNYTLFSQEIPKEGLDSIKPEDMKKHVYFLASDEMKGRNTPSPELDSCAAYIAREFAAYGLQPIGENGSYYQTLNMVRNKLSQPNDLMVTKSGENSTFEIKDDFVPHRSTASNKVSAPLVFAGYGITAPEYDYDDYQGIEVKGKIVLVFAGEPQEKDTSSVFNGRRRTKYSRDEEKIENAIEHGAIGFLLVTNPSKRFKNPPNSWPSLTKRASRRTRMQVEGNEGDKIVGMQIGRDLFGFLMKDSESSAKEIHQKIDEMLISQSFEMKDLKVSMETNLEAVKYPTRNVVGLWEGNDPVLKEELIIIGAHYDHVGVRNDTLIYNGADDNASGTCGVMEIAEAFTKSPTRPKRSVLFMAFTGEEKGLVGSRYYTEHPFFPISNTAAMLNMDMISRNDQNEIAIVGSKSSSDLKELNEKVNVKLGIELDYSQDRFFRQSDHYPFYSKDIPVLFYFAKPTEHLHKPTDDPETVDPVKMAKIGKLVFSTAWTVANMEGRPNFTKVN